VPQLPASTSSPARAAPDRAGALRILNVWLEASALPIGKLLSRDDGSLAFAYEPEWVASPDAHALSLSLPLREEPFDDAVTRSWFDNLLQENQQIRQILNREGIDRNDIAAILAITGSDCAGAVSLLPLDHPPIKRPGVLAEDYDLLDDQALRELVWRLKERLPLPEELRDPSPVAGYRDKFSLALIPDRGFAIPKAQSGAPTTHILKIPDPAHAHEARDEAFVTRLAQQCGFRVGGNFASGVGEQEILLIHRFDRIVEQGGVHRLHQEDFAQALGLPATLKYERNGRAGRRFDAAAIGTVLAATAQPVLAREMFLTATLFNLLIGNNDNHAKNHALFHLSGQNAPEMAPLYDLVPVQTVAGFRDEFSFRIGQAKRPADLTTEDCVSFARAIGIPASGALSILSRIATDLLKKLEQLSAQFPSEQKALDTLMGAEAGRINALLGLGLAIRERQAMSVAGL
jgi:serine/threonine-protein kinase HipA